MCLTQDETQTGRQTWRIKTLLGVFNSNETQTSKQISKIKTTMGVFLDSKWSKDFQVYTLSLVTAQSLQHKPLSFKNVTFKFSHSALYCMPTQLWILLMWKIWYKMDVGVQAKKSKCNKRQGMLYK